MSIKEVTGPLSAATKAPKERMFGNLPPRKRVAANVTSLPTRAELEMELDGLYKMSIPGGAAGNEVYRNRQKGIAKLERQLRRMGVNIDSQPED